MKKALYTLAGCLAALCLVSAAPSAAPTAPSPPASSLTTASAPQQAPEIQRRKRRDDDSVWARNQRLPRGNRSDGARGNRDQRWRNRTFGAPEMNPGLLAGGLALLIGGTFVILGRRRSSRVRA